MTAAQMLDELKRSLGNRNDITDARYIRWLNWALLEVCGMHKHRLFPPRRFHVLEEKRVGTLPLVTGVPSSVTGTAIVLTGSFTNSDDYYNDCVLEVTDYSGTAPDGLIGQTRIITDFVGATSTFTIDSAWDVDPDTNTTITVRPSKFDIATLLGLPATMKIWAIEMVREISTNKSLTMDQWENIAGSNVTTLGDPSKYCQYGSNLVFSPTPDDQYSYRVFFYRYPTLFVESDLTPECELPLLFHDAVVLAATWRGFSKLMEPDRASEAKNEFVDEFINKQDTYQLEQPHVQKRFLLKR